MTSLDHVWAELRERDEAEEGHGNRSRYTQGCRCDSCREANRVYMIRWRRKRGVKPLTAAPHGSAYKYKTGCRCEACTAANTAACRRWRHSHNGHVPPALVVGDEAGDRPESRRSGPLPGRPSPAPVGAASGRTSSPTGAGTSRKAEQ